MITWTMVGNSCLQVELSGRLSTGGVKEMEFRKPSRKYVQSAGPQVYHHCQVLHSFLMDAHVKILWINGPPHTITAGYPLRQRYYHYLLKEQNFD